MNDDITTEKIALRELIGKSKTIIEDLKFTIGEQHEISLLKKMDDLKKLSDDVSNLGNLRLEELEQSFVLSKELESSYTEISEWLEQKDLELRNCEVIHTGMLPEHLVKLKNHNNIILQNYRDEKPIIMKFERNVGILSNLTSKNESENLSEILNGIIERFNEQEQEFIKRGKILDETIEQSSVFGDRLDTFLSNLESANNKIRNPEPVSSNPTMIQSQINDNQSIIGLFNQKEDAFRNVKNDANTILTQCLPGDPTVSEISQKINELDILWFEIQDGLQRRSNFLSDTLQKAEKFWKELDNCQKSI
uniref:Uncharacterized protein n=1 Tax=Panagrolaimus sp. JU765 TaxID=591449 RepID=A0AC34RG09_9BILA